MKRKIGIIGGLSPESTVSYYLHITRSYVDRFGDSSYPEILIYSVNLENYHRWRNDGRWDLITDDLVKAGLSLEGSGADFCLIATNTMHKVFDEVQNRVGIPMLHLIETLSDEITKRKVETVGLLGTRFTMGDGFYSRKLSEAGIAVVVPDPEEQEFVHRIIEEELVVGKLIDSSRKKFLEIIDHLQSRGAEGVVLGCTEIPLLIKQEDCRIPVFDTAVIHADAALEAALR